MTCLNVNMKRRREEHDQTMEDQDDDFRKFCIPSSRVFECKTCNRHFPSFQALGGHRASHKKPRFSPGDDDDSLNDRSFRSEAKAHGCSICGLEFSTGQALGGHMRRHRNTANTGTPSNLILPNSLPVPMVKKANFRRILSLDLNLSPWENYIEIRHLNGSPEKRSLPKFINFL